MKKRYLITITTVHGTRHYSIAQIVKYFLAGAGVLFLAIGAGSYWYIHFLQNRVQHVQKEKRELVDQVKKLQTKTKQLQQRLATLDTALLAKRRKLEDLSSKIEDLETIMGLKGETYQFATDANLTPRQIDKILQLLPSGSPVEGGRITASYGWRRHPILKKREFHPGIDIAKKGVVPIHATADGVVLATSFSRYGYGKSVQLAHVFGFGTRYAHLRSIKVKPGQFVKKGDLIGYMGSTGLSTGQHLHYEVRFCKTRLNPIKFMKWSGKNFYTIFKERHVPWESLVKGIKRISSPTKLH